MKVIQFSIIFFTILLFTPPLYPAANEVELMFGATNIYGIVGDGYTTAAFSEEGDLTVLRWPNPSYYELLNYITSNSPDARQLPHLGAKDNMGGFGGLVLYVNDQKIVTEFRDRNFWKINTNYLSTDTDILIHQFTSKEYPIYVEQADFVDPESEVLVIAFRVNYDYPVTKAEIFYYLNPAMSMERKEFVPTYAYEDDPKKGFLLYFSRTHQVFVDFVPPESKRNQELLNSWLSVYNDGEPSLEETDNILGSGLYMMVGTNFPIREYQCGNDQTAAPGSPETDAYEDLKDGILSMNDLSTWHVNLALKGKVQKNVWKAVFISAANSATEAVARLNSIRVVSIDKLIQRTNQWWYNYISRARIPDDIPEADKNFIKRTILTIRTSMDRKTGAIVASVSNQPPYFMDWPRDGAFINYFLNTVGYYDLALQHNLFYTKMQRKKSGEKAFLPTNAPPGTFAMNYYPDGMVGGPIDFEIDETGLVLWSWCSQGKFIKIPSEKKAYYEKYFPNIKLAADTIANCKDKKTGLQCYANEDDNIQPTQGLQGAVTVYLGLRCSAEVAEYLGKWKDAQKWQSRAEELKEAIYTHLYDNNLGRFNGDFEYYANGSWAMWPVQLWSKNDPRWKGQIDFGFNKLRQNILNPSPEGSAYDAKTAIAMAYILPQNDPRRKILGRIIYELAVNLPIKTLHVGEAYMPIYSGYDYKWEDVTSIPHVWEASLISLSVLAYYHPEILELPSLPPAQKPEKTEGCSSTGNSPLFLLFLFLIPIVIRRWLWQR